MKRIICSVFDKRAGLYSAPFTAMNEAIALRDFHSAVAQSPQLNQFPDDYQLFTLAEFNDETGYIEPLTSPVILKG